MDIAMLQTLLFGLTCCFFGVAIGVFCAHKPAKRDAKGRFTK